MAEAWADLTAASWASRPFTSSFSTSNALQYINIEELLGSKSYINKWRNPLVYGPPARNHWGPLPDQPTVSQHRKSEGWHPPLLSPLLPPDCSVICVGWRSSGQGPPLILWRRTTGGNWSGRTARPCCFFMPSENHHPPPPPPQLHCSVLCVFLQYHCLVNI